MTTPAWTVRSLQTALSDGLSDAMTARVVEGSDPILLVTMHEQGDLEIFVSVSDHQIAASVLLWPVDEQEDRHAFNEFLLKAQKLVPLSNFGIGTVGDRDYYELFGELAPSSSLDDILIELRVLAENAIEAASDLRSSFTPA
ncbi:YjfI family protein [Caulobacter sp. DWR1-3-2b1]|uniref:YjfI family protein n=1 Tax=Caulobacter sp. DWR1-3-2b1 TaxID=2804670 RepID=UPI003CEFF994